MILIASGAYVIPEFQVELGKIPPCLLPIGNKKLLEFQVNALKDSFPKEHIFLSLPESYNLSIAEHKIIESLDLIVIKVPDKFNLCESLLYVLNTCDRAIDENLYLLHGDTYISNFEKLKKIDSISVSKSYDSYNWEIVKQNDHFAMIWSGFFSFSSISYFLKSLTINRNSFVDSIKYYGLNKTMNLVEIDGWFDLGHSNTYFNSRANITTQRAFNDLTIKDGIVYKTGNPVVKIEAEALWFQNIPNNLKKYTPVLINHSQEGGKYFYELEYLPYIPLNELYVHGKNEILQWSKIFVKISEYFNESVLKNIEDDIKRDINQDSYKLYVEKTKERFSQCLELGFNNKEYNYKNVKISSIDNIIEECIEKTLGIEIIHGVMHGDLCFSNILFDSRGDRIKLIDPRGMNFKSEFTIFGDLKYDFAKLSHSIVGFYDYIISGYYRIVESSNGSIEIIFDVDERVESIKNKFIEDFKLKEISVSDVMPLVVLLFISMIPLHSDRPDRQKAMFINALRLYKEFVFNR